MGASAVFFVNVIERSPHQEKAAQQPNPIRFTVPGVEMKILSAALILIGLGCAGCATRSAAVQQLEDEDAKAGKVHDQQSVDQANAIADEKSLPSPYDPTY